MNCRINVRFSKVKHISFILLAFLLIFTIGCSKKVIKVDVEKRDKTATIKTTDTDSAYSPTASTTGVGKPYYIDGIQYIPENQPQNYTQKGIASWYGKKFHGRKTASGEVYNMYAMTAAHKTLPLQTWVKVHNFKNNREIVVRINDRGPFVKGRIIDLSFTGAKKLGMADQGTAPVKVVVLGRLKNPKSKKKEYLPVDLYTGNFSIQVGAFQVRSNAIILKQELSKAYKDVHIATHKDYRGTFYRVRVGKYSTLKQALMLEKQLNVNGRKTVFLIAE
ncbi:MAG: septal ring lytic transglycosylase RlpA family protein [Desulfobacteraceae bacterium]|nr:septal ring lytic transglycosylase RlpA family protein [Desulfobacteraceae bacterium]